MRRDGLALRKRCKAIMLLAQPEEDGQLRALGVSLRLSKGKVSYCHAWPSPPAADLQQ